MVSLIKWHSHLKLGLTNGGLSTTKSQLMRDLFSGLFTNSQAAGGSSVNNRSTQTREETLPTSFCERLRCSVFHHVGSLVLPPFVLVFFENLKTLVVPVRLCERDRLWVFSENGCSGRSDHDAFHLG